MDKIMIKEGLILLAGWFLYEDPKKFEHATDR